MHCIDRICMHITKESVNMSEGYAEFFHVYLHVVAKGDDCSEF